ncbi:MAG TPA: FAD-dependent thymidylate synthase [Candidatus Corynebacterium gallistercoris]|uniref:Flavin-dependent thymidylate synthase n=1 Tax=Candidatus Corynebacterium gallistercoris TaxID=2838530 RepID=A0A9D1UPP6_9CORY|nr:FAD-dependent thymidylate synthase [Candidatus Corynebacterium gallistercoris]
MAIAVDLQVDLVGHTQFAAPADVPFESDVDDAGALVEFAGRACYETWDKPNPHTATNAAYIRHVMDVGHTTLLEHASASMYFRGVSRSCAHEMMRHRHFSFSQLSQRYVPSDEARVVVPADVAADESMLRVFLQSADVAHDAYAEILEGLHSSEAGRRANAVVREKQARQAARAVLPNCTETRFVMSGNFRSWRHFIAMRAAEHADPELRAIAVRALRILQGIAPTAFEDFAITALHGGGEMATSPYVTDM